jgi:hypothetical protein
MTRFKQGATITPNLFWFVDLVPHKLFGLDADEPLVQSSERSQLNAREYKGIFFKGKVEERYLYASLLGSDIFPYSHLDHRIVVLPVDSSGRSFRIIKKEEVQAKGHDNMLQWLIKAEYSWGKKKKQNLHNDYLRASGPRNNYSLT